MFVTIGRTEYCIRFFRNPESSTTTVCIISKIDSPNLEVTVGEGTAVLGYKDNHCKETGRQYALNRAMEDADFTDEKKSKIISNYRVWGTKRKINYDIFWN